MLTLPRLACASWAPSAPCHQPAATMFQFTSYIWSTHLGLISNLECLQLIRNRVDGRINLWVDIIDWMATVVHRRTFLTTITDPPLLSNAIHPAVIAFEIPTFPYGSFCRLIEYNITCLVIQTPPRSVETSDYDKTTTLRRVLILFHFFVLFCMTPIVFIRPG